MRSSDDRTPVLIGVAQITEREQNVSAMDLLARTTEQALADAPGIGRHVQLVSVVNVLSKIGPNPARRLCRVTGLQPARSEVTTIGGNSPQWLVNRACAAIAAGELQATLIAGVETQRSDRERREQGRSADSRSGASGSGASGSGASGSGASGSGASGSGASGSGAAARGAGAGPADEIVGDERAGVSAAEMNAGLIAPVHVYALFESVLAHRAGRSFSEQRAHIAEILAPMTEVAAKNPWAWFTDPASATELSDVTEDNRLVTEPYTKRMCALINVDQSAAVIVTSLALARQLNLADRAVFCHAGADANDVWFPTQRSDLGASPALASSARAALEAAGTGVGDIDAFDLYSCFPCAVQIGASAIGISPSDRRGLTVTGGLPYFGGPGNNYTLHSISTMASRLRDQPGTGMVTGVGWYMTKHSVGIYATSERVWRHGETAALQDAIDATALPVATQAEETAQVVAATVSYSSSGEVNAAPVIARLQDGRQIAAAAEDDELPALAGRNLVGATVHVSGSMPRYKVAGSPATR